jgi:hypothetical protein
MHCGAGAPSKIVPGSDESSGGEDQPPPQQTKTPTSSTKKPPAPTKGKKVAPTGTSPFASHPSASALLGGVLPENMVREKYIVIRVMMRDI